MSEVGWLGERVVFRPRSACYFDYETLTEVIDMDDAAAVPRLEAEAKRFVATADFEAAIKWARGLPND